MNTEKIKRLDNPRRLVDFQAEKLIELMEIKGDEIILDVGAGTGLFTFLLAEQLDTGFVNAIDINESLLNIIKSKAELKNSNNVNVFLPNDKHLFKDAWVDKVFICAVLHEVENKEMFLNSYIKLLKDKGTVYVIEFSGSKRRIGEAQNITREFIESSEVENLLKKCNLKEVESIYRNELIYMTVGHKTISK